MKIMITGGKGMLGRTLVRHWSSTHTLLIADLPDHDITKEEELLKTAQTFAPDVIVHCAAMTRVDDCESNVELATKLNVTASGIVARVATAANAKLIAISTDYVFDGETPGDRTESDPTAPVTIYGKTKLGGEQAIIKDCPNHIIARIAWLYGAGGPSFAHTMVALAKANPRRTLSVVNDQFGNPTSTDAVASALTNFLARPELTGTFHLTCEGTASWYDFAAKVFALTGYPDVDLQPCTSDAYPRPAKRPHYSSLSKAKLATVGLPPMPAWQEALRQFCKQEWPSNL